jgi:hypothetical protein
MACNCNHKALGVSPNTVRQWVSLKDKGSEPHIQKWYVIVKHMEWGTVKKRFTYDWSCQFTLDDNENVSDQLEPYRHIAERSQTVFVTKDSMGKMANPKSRSISATKQGNVKVIRLGHNCPTKRVERSDSGKPRSWIDQAKAVEQFVQGRWDGGDPVTRQETYDMLRVHDDCGEGTPFFNSFFAPNKSAALAGFLTRCLDRMNFAVRKNSIGQKVPEDWRELAVANVEEIRKALQEANVDIVVNADQTFLRFMPEQEYVLAPKGCKRVGGKVKTDEKAGCTLMVSTELNSSQLLPPFLVMNGTKKVDAKQLEQTLWWKYRDWTSQPGHTVGGAEPNL